MSFILEVLAWSLGVGVLGGLTAFYLDSIMDLGAILGELRFRLAVWYASRNGHTDIIHGLEAIKGMDDYAERLDGANELYWMLAGRLQEGKAFSWWTGWICQVCMASRVTFAYWMFFLIALLKSGASAGLIFVSLLIALTTSNFIISKI